MIKAVPDQAGIYQQYSGYTCIHHIISEQASRDPEHIALVYQGQEISYGQLESSAGLLAKQLVENGASRGRFVGIYLDRTIDMIVSILATLKAGAAYVPLDPGYPASRIEYMLEDTRADVLITHSQYRQALEDQQAKLVCLDEWSHHAESRIQVDTQVSSDDACYVIYTSGTTGKPKGVVVNHSNLVHSTAARCAYYCDPVERFLLLSSFSFDSSVAGIFWTLCSGGTLYLPRQDEEKNVADIAAYIRDNAITHTLAVPTLYRHILDQHAGGMLDSLKVVVVAGEACPVSLAGKHVDMLPACRLFNEYGPTEVTVWSSVYEVDPASLKGKSSIPIGQPVMHTEVMLLGDDLQAIDEGESGQLCLGGPGVAAGYLNQPAATEEKFITLPAGADQSSRYYLTGDLVRLDQDGMLEFIGRIDDQVKIRGYRVELGEVESVMHQHPGVAACVTTVKSNADSQPQLVAYYISEPSVDIDSESLRSWLGTRLPFYMQPSIFIELDKFPLSPSGKIDRQSLPEPEYTRHTGIESVPPRNEVEARLCDIWKDVLNIPELGIHDNFFETGGDSILGILVSSKANQAGLHITPTQIFEYPTVAELAGVVREKVMVCTQQEPVTGEVRLTPIQHWFFEQDLANMHHWNQAILVKVNHLMNKGVLDNALQQLLRQHDALRMRYEKTTDGWRQVEGEDTRAFHFVYEDISGLESAEQSSLIVRCARRMQAELDLHQGPLVAVGYFSCGTSRPSRLFIAIHHLVIDGISWRILLDDLQRVYTQLEKTNEVDLPEKTTSFQYWAGKLQAYSQEEALGKELAYWSAIGEASVSALPQDRVLQVNREGDAASLRVSLTPGQTRDLLRDIHNAYNTQINDVLLCALALTISEWVQSPHVLISLEGHGREGLFDDVDLSRTVGWFTTIFPVLLDVTTQQDLGDCLKSVKEQLRRLPNKGIGFGLLNYISEDEKVAECLEKLPQPEISFNYLGQFDQWINESGFFSQASEHITDVVFPGLIQESYDANAQRKHVLDIIGSVSSDCLSFSWIYNRHRHSQETIRRLADQFNHTLAALIAHCKAKRSVSYTPSDFPGAGLSQTQLDRLVASTSDAGNIEAIYPASSTQQGMLFYTLKAPQAGHYVVQEVFDIAGTESASIDMSLFTRACEWLVERHGILRSVFSWEHSDAPLQLVYRSTAVEISSLDWRNDDDDIQAAKLDQFLQQDRHRGFDLTRPAMRWTVIRRGRNNGLDNDCLVWSFHHALIDAWSFSRIRNELFYFYNLIVRGEAPHLPAVRPYKDYIDYLCDQDSEEAKGFWSVHLSDVSKPTLLDVRLGNGSNPDLVDEFSVDQASLGSTLSASLQTFARKNGLTLNTLFQAAWALLLSRYCDQEEVVYGTTLSGRPEQLQGSDSMVGLFILTLPNLVRVDPQRPPLEWLQHCQQSFARMMDYQHLPLVDILRTTSIASGQELFNTILLYQNYAESDEFDSDPQAVSFKAIRTIEQTNYPLTVSVIPGENVSIKMEYHTDRFSPDAIAQLQRHFAGVLRQLCQEDVACLSDISLFDTREYQKIVSHWNNTATAYNRNITIHSLFEQCAAGSADKTALVCNAEKLSYGQLNARANRLARYLQQQGLREGRFAAVCLQRSFDLVVGLLAILKAGGVYVPLDPEYPKARLQFMLNDIKPDVIITESSLLDALPQGDIKPVLLDLPEEGIEQQHDTNLNIALSGHSHAYVNYTSGSTGMPKGVLVTHRGVVRLVSEPNYMRIDETVATLHMAPASFDATTFELWAALLNGGKCVLSKAKTASAYDLEMLIKQHGVNTLWLTAAYFNTLIDESAQSLTGVRTILTGGEALSVRHIVNALEQLPGTQLINGYGPTENTTFTTCYAIPADTAATARSIPIGRPISNTTVYVLDSGMRPVPPGVKGELYIGGDGLATGYLNREALTQEKFVPDIFSGQQDARLFRSGDIVRADQTGLIDFIGRADQQVKVRGHRIEPGEIEAVLSGHKDVRQSVVTVHEHGRHGACLFAYAAPITGQPDASFSDRLSAYLREQLPQYMLPEMIIPVERFELTPNGKVDRKQLPVPSAQSSPIGEEYVPPRNANEEALAGIWQEILDVEPIGIHDNLFDLGAHSLMVMQIVSRIRQRLGVAVPIQAIFEHPDIAGLSSVLAGYDNGDKAQEQAPLAGRDTVGDIYALSYPQERLWFLSQLEPDNPSYNLPVAWHIQGRLDIDALTQAFNRVIVQHPGLHSIVFSHDDEAIQKIVPFNDLSIPVIDIPGSMPAGENLALQRQIEQDLGQVMSLQQGVMVKPVLYRLDEEDYVFTVLFHHIACDGWSVDVFRQALSKNYNDILNDRHDTLNKPGFSYRNFVDTQRRAFDSGQWQDQLAYWKTQLAGVGAIDLPADEKREVSKHYLAGEQVVTIEHALAGQLEQLAADQDCTLFMVLVSVFQLLLHRLSGQDDVAVGTPIAGRNQAEYESVMGLFLNNLVLRTRFNAEQTYIELLQGVRKTTLAAFANQDVPFEKLVETLQPDRHMDRNPLFDVFINMYSEKAGLTLDGLQVSPHYIREIAAKFDLSCNIVHSDGNYEIRFVYKAGLFSDQRMSHMLDQFILLLEQVSAAPQSMLSQLTLVTQRSKAFLPDPCAAVSQPETQPVTTLFSAWADRQPDHVAIDQQECRISYQQLERLANAIAQNLLSQGLQNGDVVAIAGEPGAGFIAAVLGTMLAGGVVMPVAIDLPEKRQQFMVSDALACHLIYCGIKEKRPQWLTQERHLPSFDVDRNSGECQAAPNQEMTNLPDIDPDSQAYIFYTSGTTGKPKGVRGSHRALSHFINWQSRTFDINAGDRIAFLTNISFDVVLRDLFLPLASGASICIAPDNVTPVLQWVRSYKVTVLHTVPSLAQEWLDAVNGEANLDSLRYVFFAGEKLTDTLVKRWRSSPGFEGAIVNLYGPTETTLAKCYYLVPSEPIAGVQPLGNALPGCHVVVVSGHNELCGVGEPGEIVISTPFHLSGYLGQATDMNEAFRQNPFSDNKHDLVYFSGDLGRYRPDGLLDIIGRKDDQVKIHGVRIEPEEITTVLSQHEKVSACHVMARKDEQQEVYLCAYVVLKPGSSVSDAELMSYIGNELPMTYVPPVYVYIDRIPLTARGKVDQASLPPPQLSRRSDNAAPSRPRTAVEESLAEIWSDVLSTSAITIEDNFFRLGGHSLMIMQVLSRLRDLYGIDLSVRDVFEAPTLSALAGRIEIMLKQSTRTELLPALQPAQEAVDYPLSFSQRRMWFLDQLDPGSANYIIFNAWQLSGNIDTACLQKAVDCLVARHESFRTAFIDVNGSPRQRIVKEAKITVTISELPQSGDIRNQDEVARLALAFAQTPFNLTQAPLIRMHLLKTGENDHVLFISVHHIVADGWTMAIILDEILLAYEAFKAGAAPLQTGLPLQYKDYAVWQQQWMDEKKLDAMSQYWRDKLDAVPPLLALPTDYARPQRQTHAGASLSVPLPEDLSRDIEKCARDNNVTLFMFLLAAFKLLLHRYSGSDDILVGSPIAGRHYSETEKLAGLFVNTLVYRTQFSQDMDFVALLAQVKTSVLESFSHQDMPFEKLVEILQPERDMSHSPLFQVSFALQNIPGQEVQRGGLSIRQYIPDTGTAKFDLTLSVLNADGKLSVNFNYNTDLFAAETIERMSRHFLVLLDGVVEDPYRAVDSFPMLTVQEKQTQLVDWNQRYQVDNKVGIILELIAAQAEKHPDAIAVASEHTSLSYAELIWRSNKLANYLLHKQLTPESHVGVCVARTPDLLVAVLAILKAGGCYVPMDPSYPEKRLQYYLQDGDIDIVLADRHTASIFSDTGNDMVLLDDDWPQIDAFPLENPEVSIEKDQLAYIIYTSGSTGQPKGVMVTHANLWHSTKARLQFYQQPVGCFCLLSSYAFDSSVAGLFWTLSSGGKLYLPDDGIELDTERLTRVIGKKGVSHLLCVPGLYALMLEHAPDNRLMALDSVIVAGEPCPPDLYEKHRKVLPDVNLYNEYGPTEATVWSTVYHFDRGVPDGQVPIGRPIPAAQVYILNPALQPVPVGVTGEVFIGGPGVARGYLKREDLTAERFIANPLDNNSGNRLYRTGDLAFYRSDGNIVFCGRVDEQVKLRGYRIELGEIESLLNQYPGVKQSVVTVREDRPGDRRLAAYYCEDKRAMVDVNGIRSYMKQYLPDHMVPYAYVRIDSIPLTANGKTDRQSLPAPGSEHVSTRAMIEPSTDIEKQLCDIWNTVLGQEKVSIEDNFFDLGGHSLLLTQVAARVRSILSVDVPLRAYFEAPTIAQLANYVAMLQENQQKRTDVTISPVTTIQHQDYSEYVPLSLAQQSLWLMNALNPDSAFYNMSSIWQLNGKLDLDAMLIAINQVVERHESLRTVFTAQDEGPVQRILPSLTLDLPLVDASKMSREALQVQLDTLSRQVFDLSQGPLLRFYVYRLAQDRHVLQISIHHIVSDGWSMDVLLKELAQCYESALAQSHTPLPVLPIQYADYTLWQREYLQGDILDNLVSYWKQQLAGVPELLSLPCDRQRPAEQRFKGANRSRLLPLSLHKSVRALSKQHNATLFMTYLAAYQVLLHRYCQEEDIVVGTPVAGRDHAEIEPLIGFFINTLVIRTDTSGNPDFVTLLSRVRELTLDAFAHQALPFEMLVEELQPQRSRQYSPLFQVAFVLQNETEQSLSLPGLDVESMSADTGTSKFDLTLFMTETDTGLDATIEYNVDLFDAITIDRMLVHLEMLLQGIVKDPTQGIDTLPLLTTAEREQLLFGWNRTRTDYPDTRSIHAMFSEQACRHPDSIAIRNGNASLTYAELDQQSDRLAGYLQGHGVGKGDRVAFCLVRSPEMIISMLAILKTGAAYVPLDPEYPESRLSYMLKDANVKVLVTTSSLLTQIPRAAVTAVCLDLDSKKIKQHEPVNPVDNGADDIAYVIYTSGSTGQPKGVMVPHRGVVRLVVNTDYVQLEQSDVIAQVSNASFDAATFEIWGALMSGASLAIFDKETVLSPKTFATALRDNNVSATFLTTALFNLMAKEMPDAFSSVKYVLFGGEAVDPSSVRKVLDSNPPSNLLHVYGPTENTTFSTWYHVEQVEVGAYTLPIGRPVANTTMYVLSPALEPVPVGVVGELMLGGDGLASGYLNNDTLTREKFIDNPFVVSGKEKIYRTGDKVRYLPDGNIEFVGRTDHQVKVRGFRIELGEIEAVILQHQAVSGCVVMIREEEKDKQIAAYIAAQGLTRADAMEWMQQYLPPFSIPTEIYLLDALPLTANGKIDRKALERMESNDLDETGHREEVDEHTDTVIFKLTEIWKKILKKENIRATDDFFQCGGHSLSGVHLLTDIEKSFGVRLPLSALFEHRTVRCLASALRDEGWSLRWDSMVPVQSLGSKPAFFCVHGRASDISKYLGNEQPFYWLHHAQHMQEVKNYSVEEIALDHLKEIQVVQPHGPYYLGGFSFGGMLALEIARLLKEKGESVALMALFDPSMPRSKSDAGTKAGKVMELMATEKSFLQKAGNIVIKAQIYFKNRFNKLLTYLLPVVYKRLLYRWYVLTKRTVPADLRVFELVQLFRQAAAEYQHQEHVGDIDLFIPEGRGKNESQADLLISRWKDYVSGEVRIHTVKGARSHHAIVEEPFVRNLAMQLAECLEQARSAQPGKTET